MSIRALFERLQAKAEEIYIVDQSPNRIVAMEGLRGLAVILVFFVHFDSLFGMYAQGVPWLRGLSLYLGTIGNSGVDLFFLLSGYLIYGALIRKEVPYFKFLKRRIERLYPTFLTVLSIYVFLCGVAPAYSKLPASAMKSGLYLLQNLLFIPGIFHIEPLITVCWSLSFEWAFYLMIPLLISLLRMKKWPPKQRVFALAAMWVLAGLWCALFARGMRLRMATFLCGAALYELQSMGSLVHVARRSWELAALATTALGTYMLYVAEKNSGHRMAFDYVMPIMALGVAFFVLCAAVIGYNGSANRIFLWTPLRYLGNMSFSYFLLHGLTLKAVSILARAVQLEYTWKNFVFLMLFGFACTWITSTVLFVLIEKRFSLASGQKVAAGSVLATCSDVQAKQENISSVSI